MATYSYECGNCRSEEEIIKPISQIDLQESCKKCGKEMHRIITAVRANTSNCQFQAHHNWAFGKVVNSKRELEECRRRLSAETGKDIVEVGTDDLKSVKKQRKKYSVDGLQV